MNSQKDSSASKQVKDGDVRYVELIKEIVKLEKDSIHRSELSVVARRAKIRDLIDSAFAASAKGSGK